MSENRTPASRWLPALLLAQLAAASPVLASSAPAARPAAPAPPSPAAAEEMTDAKFREEGRMLMKIGSLDQMATLVKRHDHHAVLWIIDLADLIAQNRGNEEIFQTMTWLRRAWEKGMGTRFVEEVEAYVSLLDRQTRAQRGQLVTQYNKTTIEHVANRNGDKDQTRFKVAAAKFEELAKAFEDIGDRYMASQAWMFVAETNDQTRRGEQADLDKAARALRRMLELREKIDLKDSLYALNKSELNRLEALGYGEGGGAKSGAEGGARPAEAAAAAPVAPGASGSAVTIATSFELMADVQSVERPSFFLDEHYPLWNAVVLGRSGSSQQWPRIGGMVNVLRVTSARISVDTDLDGEGDVEIPMTGKLTPLELRMGSGPEERGWGVLIQTGVDRDVYQHIEASLAPAENYFTLYFAPAASVTGSLEGTAVRVFDDNVDGLYGSPPEVYAHAGLSAGRFMPEMDSILVGKGKRARPWSRYQEIGGKWYQLEPLDAGTRFSAMPVEVATGTLVLDYDGPKPKWLVVAGQEPLGGSYFDLAAAGARGVEVPAGTYALYYGELRKGKKRQEMKTCILPGEATPKWTVGAGEKVTVKLGAPYGFDFDFEAAAESVTLKGTSVVVTGSAGERYERAWGCVPRPEVSVREIGERREESGQAQWMKSQEELYASDNMGWHRSWFPSDLQLDRPGGGALEMRLVEKKHPLFGKVESEWKRD